MTVQMPLFERRQSERVATHIARAAEGRIDTFVENFDVLVNAAGSTKHLKELILQCAVQGKLLPPSDETAELLVSEVRRARAALGEKGLRVGAPSDPIGNDEVPYALPSGWRWVRLRDLGGFLGGGTPAKSNAAYWKGPLPWVSPKDMKRPYIDDAEDHISMAAVEGSAAKLIPAHSLLYVVRGMILAHSFPVAVATREVAINQDMKALVPAIPAMHDFILRTMQAAKSRVLAKVERSSHGTCRLDSEVVEQMPMALPPLAEQKRIVVKVDQLMALCDDLEARQNKKREVGARLTKSALEALTTAEGPEDFDAAWKRVVENFDVLVDRAEKVGELRRAVLEAGIRGRLVRQHGADEPVERLWKRIGDERAGLLEGKRRGGKGQGKADADPLPAPHSIPKSWMWCQLGDVAGHIVDGTHHTPKYRENGVAFISAKDIKGGKLVFDKCRYISEEEFTELAGRCCPKRGDVLVTKSGSIGEVAIVDTDRRFTLFESVALIPVVPSVDPRFVAHVAYLGASGKFGMANQKGVGVTHLHLVDLRRLPFPLPPLEEQRRIVAKIDHLTKLCDDLEEHLRRAEGRASKLVEAVVSELVS